MRQNAYLSALPNLQCGPSLLTAGQWTKGAMFHANLVASPRCARCGADFEDLHHRLWDCPSNKPLFDRLIETLPPDLAAFVPDRLPACLTRCGLCPRRFDMASNADISRIQAYLDQVSCLATTATAASKDCSGQEADKFIKAMFL